jgi:choline-sulfatase
MLDHNIGLILAALRQSGLEDETTVIYTSDHGDNLGARGLWGKSNFYEESVAVPLIVATPGQDASCCETPVSLLDLSATIVDHFGLDWDCAGTSLYDIAASPDAVERLVFSEYHAAGGVTGAYMVRKGRWKYIHYIGFDPELFDLQNDPEELVNLSHNKAFADVLAEMEAELRAICDPEAVDAQAFADQAAMIERYGGRDAALKLGAPGATPPPQEA